MKRLASLGCLIVAYVGCSTILYAGKNSRRASKKDGSASQALLAGEFQAPEEGAGEAVRPSVDKMSPEEIAEVMAKFGQMEAHDQKFAREMKNAKYLSATETAIAKIFGEMMGCIEHVSDPSCSREQKLGFFIPLREMLHDLCKLDARLTQGQEGGVAPLEEQSFSCLLADLTPAASGVEEFAGRGEAISYLALVEKALIRSLYEQFDLSEVLPPYQDYRVSRISEGLPTDEEWQEFENAGGMDL